MLCFPLAFSSYCLIHLIVHCLLPVVFKQPVFLKPPSLPTSQCVFLLSHLCYLLYNDPFSHLRASPASVLQERGGGWGSGKEPQLSPGRTLFQGLGCSREKTALIKDQALSHTVSLNAHNNSFRKFPFSFLQIRKLRDIN